MVVCSGEGNHAFRNEGTPSPMKNLKQTLAALVATAILALGFTAATPAATAGAVPITPTINSCTAPNVTYFNNRVCVDPTTGYGRLVSVFTNNRLVYSATLTQISYVYGCRDDAVFSAAWYPYYADSSSVLGSDYIAGNPQLRLTDSTFLSCGGYQYDTNTYVATPTTIATINQYKATHTLVLVS